ncbi:MAG TPA: ATP-binding protein [Pyrinomonadaceae bacterium]|nr:ATP-binding protein [Pyrinomonadaceae bacterium]
MSRRDNYLILVLGAGLPVIILLPSLTARTIAAMILGLGITLFLIKSRTNHTANEQAVDPGGDSANEEPSQEIFALGKLFEATMTGMREGLLVVDKDMRVVASNTAAHRLFNLSRGKLDGQRLTELTRNPAIYSAFLDALKGTERSGVKVETHGPERLIFDLRTVPLSSANGRSAGSVQGAPGALGVFIDVTRLERLEQVRQEFLSNVSHELRTPLTAILAFIETLEAGALDDKEASQRFLTIIRRNAMRMQELIDDILELSAIEAGNVQVRTEQLELAPVVSDVISSLANKASAKGIVVRSAVANEARVLADARRLEQMLTNLIENAIKFNRENGGVTIRLETSVGDVEDSSPCDRIVVEDSGEGIPAQHLERLFERFYRVDRARSRDLGGIGLGLAIVKHLARAHGGEVTVSSEVGKGSAFTIELPRPRLRSDRQD